ncbi:MAG: glycosyltransferase family 4 protein [Bacteroidetes bacterium]|nr:glycosyltransferase family 4 protein [Bacteroidota bacterium]
MGRNEKVDSIIFVTDHGIPFGSAASNRMMALAKGIHRAGWKVNILILLPTDLPDYVKNMETEGEGDGFHFYYTSGSTVIPKNPIVKHWMIFRGWIKAGIFIYRISQKERVKGILMFHTKTVYPLSYYFLSKILRITFLHERNEYPFLLNKRTLLNRLDLWVYEKLVVRLFDGIFVITEELKRYFSQLRGKSEGIVRINMVVDTDRFATHNIRNDQDKYIAFCGHLWGDKDGIPILLEAFSLIHNKIPDIKLMLIGDIRPDIEFRKLKSRIEALDITDKVIFTGKATKNEIPSLLHGAEVLVLARPNNIQARGGFPTKLGEYLASGRPVVITRTGEIGDFLEDKRHAFLVEPDKPELFGEMMVYAIQHPQEAEKIGIQGKELTNDVFSFEVQSKRLMEFVKSLS